VGALGANKPRFTLLQFLLRELLSCCRICSSPSQAKAKSHRPTQRPSPRLSSQSRIRQIRKKVKTRDPVPERWAIIQEGTYCTIIIACLAFALPPAVAHRGQLGQGATPSELTQSEIFWVIFMAGLCYFFFFVFVLFLFFALFQRAQKEKKQKRANRLTD
jgi:hypothetical protein